MKDKKDLLETYLHISPSIFNVRQENNEVDREEVDLNDRVVEFVKDINVLPSTDENIRNEATLNESLSNGKTLNGTNNLTREGIKSTNNTLLKEYFDVFELTYITY